MQNDEGHPCVDQAVVPAGISGKQNIINERLCRLGPRIRCAGWQTLHAQCLLRAHSLRCALPTHLLSRLSTAGHYFCSRVQRPLADTAALMYMEKDREPSLTHTPVTWFGECFVSLKPTHVPGVMNVVAHLLSMGNTLHSWGLRVVLLAHLATLPRGRCTVGVLMLKDNAQSLVRF